MSKRSRVLLTGLLATAVVLSGCSTKGGSTSEAKAGSDGVKTDFGVTDKTISLGVMTDLSGPFKVNSLPVTYGNQMWADDVNAAGGICGRDIKVEVRDTAQQADKAVALYPELEPKVLGIMQLTGSPILAALKSSIKSDNMLTLPTSWASTNLDAPQVFMIGSTYDIDMMNGLNFLKDQGKIKDGDKIGHIYVDSEFGKGGLLGSEYWGKQHGSEIVGVKVTAEDKDMSSAVTQLKSQGVKAILMSLSPSPAASVATQAQAQGLQVPLMFSSVSFDPTLLDTPAKDALLNGNTFRVSSVIPAAADNPLVKKIMQEYDSRGYKEIKSDSIVIGYMHGLAWQGVLEQACKDKDLTRAGIMAAKKKSKVNTQGLSGKLDFSQEGSPSSRETLVEAPSFDVVGRLVVVQPFKESADAKSYKAPHQK